MSDLHQLSHAADIHRHSGQAYDTHSSSPSDQPRPTAIVLPPMRSSPPPRSPAEESNCHWCILNSELSFLYIDPEFARHIGPLANTLLGRSLMEFVRIEERPSVYDGLRGLSNFTGSVTQSVTFAGTRRLRSMLGYGPAHSSWQAGVIDYADYVPTDIVLNWVSDGVALCFLHTSCQDTSPDPSWTDCSTESLTDHDVRALHNSLMGDRNARMHIAPDDTCERVFQIFENTVERRPLLTWPLLGRLVPEWNSTDYIRAAAEVGTDATNRPADAITNCTGRYQKQKTISTAVWGKTELRSAVIPHGAIIFAYHRLAPPERAAPPERIAPEARPFAAYGNPEHSTYGTSYSYTPSAQQTYSASDYPQWSYGYSWTPDPYSAPPTQNYNVTDLYPSYSATNSSRQPQSLATTPESAKGSRRRASTSVIRGGPTRSGGVPPFGVIECVGCGTTSSPEWRKGESGKKDLCNACGLRFARRKAKAKGTPSQRRKKLGLSHEDADMYLQGSRRGSVDSTATTSTATTTTSTQVDTPPGSSACTPSPPTNILELSHYSYAPQPDHHPYYVSPADAFTRASQPYYDSAGRQLCGTGAAYSISSLERIKH